MRDKIEKILALQGCEGYDAIGEIISLFSTELKDAAKWRKVEEIASYSKEGEWACPPNCPCDVCRKVHDDFDCDIAKSLVAALSEVPHGK